MADLLFLVGFGVFTAGTGQNNCSRLFCMFEFPVTAFLFRKDVTGILQILDQLANLARHSR
jgi:hypothetical protein